MAWQNPPDDVLRDLLRATRTVAVVGCSPDPDKTSHRIAAQLQRRGFRIVPVHPSGGTILGEQAYPDLDAIPADTSIDVVDVFLRPERVPPVAEAAVRRHARALWLQQGIVSDEAARIATRGGLLCVMDLCLGVMSRTLLADESGARPQP